jgi:transposase
MYDVNDDAKGGFRRIEILTGPARRRRWSADEKARIVAETLAPGARVSEVARRWQVCPQQVFAWWHAARRDATTPRHETMSPAAMAFVPIVTETAPPEASTGPAIEVKLAGAVVRVACGMDGALLTVVLRAVRASASRT